VMRAAHIKPRASRIRKQASTTTHLGSGVTNGVLHS